MEKNTEILIECGKPNDKLAEYDFVRLSCHLNYGAEYCHSSHSFLVEGKDIFTNLEGIDMNVECIIDEIRPILANAMREVIERGKNRNDFEQKVKEDHDETKNFKLVYEAIKTELERGETKLMTCPVCNQKTLNASVSGYNGHVHAYCETEGCIRFME